MPGRSSCRCRARRAFAALSRASWSSRSKRLGARRQDFASGALVSLDLAACLADPHGAAAAARSMRPGRARRSRTSPRPATCLLATIYRNVRGSAVAYRFDGRRVAGDARCRCPTTPRCSSSPRATATTAPLSMSPGICLPNTLYLADLAADTAGAGQIDAGAVRRRRRPSSSSSRRSRTTARRCRISSSGRAISPSTATRRPCSTAMAGSRCR